MLVAVAAASRAVCVLHTTICKKIFYDLISISGTLIVTVLTTVKWQLSEYFSNSGRRPCIGFAREPAFGGMATSTL